MKDTKKKKDVNMSIRCSEEELNQIEQGAAEAGMTRSRFTVKAATLGSVKLLKAVQKKKNSTEICRIRTLLNELPDSPTVRELHKEVDKLWKL